MANEKPSVTTEPSPESLWGALHLWSGGALYRGIYICALGLDILKLRQTSLFYSDSYFNFGSLQALFRKGQAHQRPPMTTGLGGKTSGCFLMQLTRKSILVMRYVKLAREVMSNVLFIGMTGPKVAKRIQVVPILLHEAKPVPGLFFLNFNTIG